MRKSRRPQPKRAYSTGSRQHFAPKTSIKQTIVPRDWAYLASLEEDHPAINLKLGEALYAFLVAPDWRAAGKVISQNRILLRKEATDILEDVSLEMQLLGVEKDVVVLQDHIAVLKYFRRRGVRAALQAMLQAS